MTDDNKPALKQASFSDFLADIYPYLYGKACTYVDIGAFDGTTVQEVADSPINFDEIVAVEPNPDSYQKLLTKVKLINNIRSKQCLNNAMGANDGTVTMRSAGSMTTVMTQENTDLKNPEDKGHFSAQVLTLDNIATKLTDHRITVLKIDVEGFEPQVLSGGIKLLKENRVDIIYLEAGFNEEGQQQTYYQELDNILTEHEYRVFRIYEQQHEWRSDSPLLRRANIAYMNSHFASSHPHKVMTELFDCKRKESLHEETIRNLKKEINSLKSSLERTEKKLAKAREPRLSISRIKRKIETKIKE